MNVACSSSQEAHKNQQNSPMNRSPARSRVSSALSKPKRGVDPGVGAPPHGAWHYRFRSSSFCNLAIADFFLISLGSPGRCDWGTGSGRVYPQNGSPPHMSSPFRVPISVLYPYPMHLVTIKCGLLSGISASRCYETSVYVISTFNSE